MRARYLFCLLLSLWAAVPAAGQTVRIVGRVVDDATQRPLGDAQVALHGASGRYLGRTETAGDGTFEFEVSSVSAVRIDARRISYKSNLTPLLHFDGRTFFQVEIRLDPDAILLAPLEVLAWSKVEPSPFLESFKQRVETGMGIYITREQIEKRRPSRVADLLREVPGVAVTGSGGGNRPTIQVGRSLVTPDCPTQIWVDGFLMNRRFGGRNGGPTADFRLDDAVSPLSIEGIEIYRGLGSVPAEFLNPDAKCGVIAVWTRRGARRQPLDS